MLETVVNRIPAVRNPFPEGVGLGLYVAAAYRVGELFCALAVPCSIADSLTVAKNIIVTVAGYKTSLFFHDKVSPGVIL